jgi:hypothetical protein
VKIDKAVRDKVVRLFLRGLPFVPGPELYDLLGEVKKSQDDIDSQVTEAIESIQKTSVLVTRLEDSLKERAGKLEDLRKEHDRYSQLAKIEATKAEALLGQIEATLGKNQGRERWISFWINIAAGLVIFILGVVLSEPLQKFFSKLWTAITK